jgi:uncharacterized damage-inducible protein DinB
MSVMKKTALSLLFLAGGFALYAQAPAAAPAGAMPMLGEVKTWYGQIKGNLTRMAEKMPADSYDFKATPDIRTFGDLMAHIADSQLRSCSAVNGAMKNPTPDKKTKEQIVAAMKESFDECDKAFEGTTDANAMQMMSMGGRGQTSRLGLLTRFVVVHGNEEYGYGSIYLRLKGIVPPSSDNAGRGPAPAAKK